MELYFKTRGEWRNWLDENHSKVRGVWLVYYKKNSEKPRIPYNDAVEEALCYGWIDGKIKRVNEDYYIQWFTPRRPGSRWSKLNMERAGKLIKEGKMRHQGLKAYEETVKEPGLIYEIRTETNISLPDDLLTALQRNSEAYINFNNFPPSSQRLYLLWLSNAKREETRVGRITKIVARAEKNIRAGMM
jgi:uncharacterized protein YdeI (YjbR/CyaY-like superfamily)